ncbi:MAG: BrnA antitoxin family protein [Steroidobacteraceae bacterium]
MKKGFFSRFGRPGQVETLAPGVVPRAEAAATAASSVAKIVKGIARNGLPHSTRKAAISLRLDPDVLEWFKTQGPGYQTRMNAVLKAYMDASRS